MHDSLDEHMLGRILENNDHLAKGNREHFDEMGSFVINFMSAPGAGKTTLILEISRRLRAKLKLAVIEGDMVGDLDARRIKEVGIEAFQISTGRSCHLDAAMIARLLHAESHPEGDLIIIENVGNLVCPAEFPLGEHLRVVLLSVTEGDDKPLKYPVIFRDCDAVVFTKSDLLTYVDFDLEKVRKTIGALNPHAQIFSLSVKGDDGVTEFVNWIESKCAFAKVAACK